LTIFFNIYTFYTIFCNIYTVYVNLELPFFDVLADQLLFCF